MKTTLLLEMALSWGETLKDSVVGLLVVICVLAIIAVFILLLSKIIGGVENASAKKTDSKSQSSAVTETAVKPAGRPLSDSESQGELKLENVDDPTAATIMAIVSDNSGIPLNRLAFKSIKLIEEK